MKQETKEMHESYPAIYGHLDIDSTIACLLIEKFVHIIDKGALDGSSHLVV